MPEATYRYLAVDWTGRRVRGELDASDESRAFDQLRRNGLSPLQIRRRSSSASAQAAKPPGLREREATEYLASLADLLRAGADMRSALGIMRDRSDRQDIQKVSDRLLVEIGSGEPLDRAFGNAFTGRQSFVGSMVAAGEAAGDLPGSLQRASEVIASRLRLRDQMAGVLAYPLFVLASAIGALFLILLFVVPAIAPLTQELGSQPPPALAVMLGASDFLRGHGAALSAGSVALLLVLLASARMGLLSGLMESLVLDGPARRTAAGLIFGSFSVAVGTMVSSGAPISDALRLGLRSVRSAGARRRLEPVIQSVREGEMLSLALAKVRGFPAATTRLVAVGEASNSVGELLARSGRMEEDAALRRIEAFGRLAGPALIIMLGVLLGSLMAALLTSVSQMGQSALN